MKPLYINTVILILFLVYLFYTKRPLISKVLVAIWTFSFLCGCIYAQLGFTERMDISCASVIYIDLCILIYLYPIIVNEVHLDVNCSKSTIYYCEQLLLILGILFTVPFFENVVQFVSIFSTPSDSIIDIYNNKMDIDNNQEIVTWLDPISLQVMQSFGRFNKITLFLAFIIATKKHKISYTRLFFYFIAIFTPVVGDINTSGRGVFAFFIINVLILYLMFKNNIKVQIQRPILLAAGAVIGICIVGIVIITQIRADVYEADIWIWTSLYFGEGPVRFCNYMWNIKCSMEGDNSFSFFKEILGFDTIQSSLKRREVWNENVTGVDPIRFYTFIGDWFSDLGGYFTLLFITFLSYYMNKFLRKKEQGLTGSFLAYIYLYIFATGYTYFCFKAYYGQYTVVFGVLSLFVLTKIGRRSKDLMY